MRSEVENRILLDLGSRSAKAYVVQNSNVEEISQITWDLLDSRWDEELLRTTLASLLQFRSVGYKVFAIGTEAMRRNPLLEGKVVLACRQLNIAYQTLSHLEEAKLIRMALPHLRATNIVNVGGGSIQIVNTKSDQIDLLKFGISDLNQIFSLHESSQFRRAEECVGWVTERLPEMDGVFIYTGGERKYLLHFGVPMEGLYCSRKSFEDFAFNIAVSENDELQRSSPYDSKWMSGAIASNCIVRALLHRSGADEFIPCDLNIAHGLATVLLQGKQYELFK